MNSFSYTYLAFPKKSFLYINWLSIVEGDLKAPFSLATTPNGREGRYSFLKIALLTLDLYHKMPSVKQGGIKYHYF